MPHKLDVFLYESFSMIYVILKFHLNVLLYEKAKA